MINIKLFYLSSCDSLHEISSKLRDVTGPRDPKLKKRGKNCVNADAVKEPPPQQRDKKGARGKDQTAGSSRACVPLGKDLFLAEKVGTRSTQVQPQKPWKACVTMRVRACGIVVT